jgi:restriction system protein
LWSTVWPYVLAVTLLALIIGAGRRLWRTHHALRRTDQQWRAEDQIRAGHRTLAEVDAMSEGGK